MIALTRVWFQKGSSEDGCGKMLTRPSELEGRETQSVKLKQKIGDKLRSPFPRCLEENCKSDHFPTSWSWETSAASYPCF